MARRAVVILAAVAMLIVAAGLVQAHRVKLVAGLSGAAVAPDPGDPDGSGRAVLRLNDERKKICFRITYENIAEPDGGHIHKGAKGVAGDVVAGLFSGAAPSPIEGCATDVARSLIRAINKNPKGYYVQMHNSEFPAGAIRGQLRRPQ